MVRRLVALVAAMWLAASVPVGAQQSSDRSPWRLSWFPYLTVSPGDGVMGVAHAILFRQAGYDDRVSLRDAVTLDAGYSTHDAWLVRARGDFPRIADGWRLQATAEASRSPRFGDPDVPEDLARQAVGVEVTRRVAGRLQLAVHGGVEHVRDDLPIAWAAAAYPGTPIESPCFLVDPLPGGSCDGATLRQTDVTARGALVLDLRDREYNPLNGALLQGGVFFGSAVDGYHGAYAEAKGWLSPRESTHLTARLALRAVSETGGFGILHTMPAWEHFYTTLGGPESQRGLPEGRYPGRGLLLGGAEARQDLFRAKGIFAVSALAFVDGGRSFDDLQLTLDHWSVSGGGGVAVRILRNAVVTVTAARGEGRTRWYVSSGWGW